MCLFSLSELCPLRIRYDDSFVVILITLIKWSVSQLHIWGKKLQIPESLPVTYQAELTEIMKKVSRKKFKVLQE